MNWFIKFLSSSIGRKLIMSLTGLFLILFLTVHLIGNLQLFKDDGGQAFNVYAHFMTSNPLIKFIAYGNYFFILLHAFMGIYIASYNRKAKGQQPAVTNPNVRITWASKNMPILGGLILAFLLMHMGDFWLKMKLGNVNMVSYAGIEGEVKNLYERVAISFKELWVVIVYLVGLVALAFHLNHGFQSAFQTLGINHRKYTPLIKKLGLLYSLIVPIGFALMPIYYYFFR
ncbi:MAG: succinate dehydrogenase cytochrome b subunit [Chitinophagales bacterium]|nr:succinate dehydrogenase cytochrome b subunit [Chitinophagales bacterium]